MELLTMKERQAVTKAIAEQYRKGTKGERGRILEQFVKATGYVRCYARRLLRSHRRRLQIRPGLVLEGDLGLRSRRVRQRRYGDEVAAVLKKVWIILDYITGKRMAAALPAVVPRLVACGEIRVKKAIQNQLMQISPATIDRLLKEERKKHTLKGRATTKPGTLLKHQVPIRTFSDWDDARPGFLEMDLVGHDGGKAEGEYCFTLDLTDVASGWTEQKAIPNKAQTWVFAALKEVREGLPFLLLGLDSDNGSEFINHHLVAYCREEKITFTRSRPYRKNDTCYVEQKNWSIVRRFVGYSRFDTPQANDLLKELYRVLRLYTNFFLPSVKLKEKTREGARVRRRYDKAQTPYQRILSSPHVDRSAKERLTRCYEALNPAALHRQIRKLQRQLERLGQRSQKEEAA
jgi:hypothetical protein